MKVDFSVREHELLVRLRLIQRDINKINDYIHRGVIEMPHVEGYSLPTALNDIEELTDLDDNSFQLWRETEAVTIEVMRETIKNDSGGKETTHVYTDLCHKCDDVVQYTDVFSCCPNCLASF